jgi:hypothetical protein
MQSNERKQNLVSEKERKLEDEMTHKGVPSGAIVNDINSKLPGGIPSQNCQKLTKHGDPFIGQNSSAEVDIQSMIKCSGSLFLNEELSNSFRDPLQFWSYQTEIHVIVAFSDFPQKITGREIFHHRPKRHHFEPISSYSRYFSHPLFPTNFLTQNHTNDVKYALHLSAQ